MRLFPPLFLVIVSVMLMVCHSSIAVEPGRATEQFFDRVDKLKSENAQEMIRRGQEVPPQPGEQDAPLLQIEIRTLQPVVKNTQDLSINTKIQNAGKDDQHLQIWSCSYPDNWRSDNKLVGVVQVPCDKNGLQDVALKPGAAYERELSVRVSLNAKELQQESVTFRLGFSPSPLPAGSPGVIWSNSVTVTVKE